MTSPKRRPRRAADGELDRRIAASDGLTELLAAASAPASEAELAGEPAALQLFRQARVKPAGAAERAVGPSPARQARRTGLVLAGGVLAAMLAGAGAAAAAGTLPAPLQTAAHQLFNAPPAPTPAPSRAGVPGPSGSVGSRSPAGSKPPTSTGGPAGGSTSTTPPGSGSGGSGTGSPADSPSETRPGPGASGTGQPASSHPAPAHPSGGNSAVKPSRAGHPSRPSHPVQPPPSTHRHLLELIGGSAATAVRLPSA